MHKNNIRFVHTYNAVASSFIVRSPERSDTIDNGEYHAMISHVDQLISMMIDLFVRHLILKSLPKIKYNEKSKRNFFLILSNFVTM
jgi:hypothetical protein